MDRLTLGLVAALGAAGCVRYDQTRTALVPHMAPLQTTGQPQPTRVAVGFGATTASDLMSPSLADANAGVAIPKQQGRAQIGLALTENQSIAAIYEVGSSSHPHVFNESLPKLDDRVLQGGGIQYDYSFRTSDERVRVGVALELMNWHVPWVAKDRCIDNCDLPDTDTTATLWGYDSVPTFGLGVTPSYRAGDFIAFGGVTVKNHPTLTNETTNFDHEPVEVRVGHFAGTLAAGVAYEHEKRVRLAVEISQTILGGPINYGPTVGGWLSVGFGDPPRPRPRPTVPSVIYVPASNEPTYGPPYPAPPPPP